MAISMGSIVGFILWTVRVGSSLHIEGTPTSTNCPFEQRCGENCIGTPYGGMLITLEAGLWLDALDPKHTVVWSFGVGNDVSFDITLACKYGFRVKMFDPSPSARQHILAVHKVIGKRTTSTWRGELPEHSECKGCENYWDNVAHSRVKPSLLNFYQNTIASVDGNLTFYGTENKSRGVTSWSLNRTTNTQTSIKKVIVASKTLSHLMRKLSTKKIDVLRIYLQGMQELIISQVLKLSEDSRPQLIFVDFSPNKMTKGWRLEIDNKKAKHASDLIKELEKHGYRHARGAGAEVTFFKRRP